MDLFFFVTKSGFARVVCSQYVDVSVLEQPFKRDRSHLPNVDDLAHLAVDQLPSNPSKALTLFLKGFARSIQHILVSPSWCVTFKSFIAI